MRTNSFRVILEVQNSLKRMCKMATEEPETEPDEGIPAIGAVGAAVASLGALAWLAAARREDE